MYSYTFQFPSQNGSNFQFAMSHFWKFKPGFYGEKYSLVFGFKNLPPSIVGGAAIIATVGKQSGNTQVLYS